MNGRFAAGLIAGLILGLLLGRAVTATSRSAATVIPADAWHQIEAPHDPAPVPAAATEDARPEGFLSPAAEVGPNWGHDQPTATVAASMPEPSPEPAVVRTAATPGSQLDANSHNALRGVASWFCLPGRSACTRGFAASGYYAAAGPALRSALGPGWRGTVVTVTAHGSSVRTRLVDWCRCDGGRVVDLYASVFVHLAPLSRGIVSVEVRW